MKIYDFLGIGPGYKLYAWVRKVPTHVLLLSWTHSLSLWEAYEVLEFRIGKLRLLFWYSFSRTIVGCLKYCRFLDMIIPNTIKKMSIPRERNIHLQYYIT